MFTRFSARALVVGLMLATIFVAYVSATHSWGPYHWARTSNPFTLTVVDSVTPIWDAYLDGAITDWTIASVLDLTKVAGSTNSTQRWLCRPVSGRIRACNYPYGNTGWLGLAQIWITGGEHITQGTTELNDTYFNTATYNTPAWRRLVTCQEIAHDFGLAHQDEIFDNSNLGSCMDYTSNPLGPPSNEHPNPDDYNQIEIIYSHLDGTSTVGTSKLPSSMPPAMGQINFDTPAQWGRRIWSSANGRVQLFELDFGGGHKVITRVVWADAAADGR